MGAYVNHPIGKEIWLHTHGTEIAYPIWEEIPEGYLPVVLVDNGTFTAAGIAYSEQELDAFLLPDLRSRRYFIAPINKLHEVSGELKGYMERS